MIHDDLVYGNVAAEVAVALKQESSKWETLNWDILV